MQVFLRAVSRALIKFGNGDAGQEADDRDHNHDFNERERPLFERTEFSYNVAWFNDVNPAPLLKVAFGPRLYLLP